MMNGPITRFEFIVVLLLIVVGLIPFLKQVDLGALYLDWMRTSQIDSGFLGLFHLALIVAGFVAIFGNRNRE